MKANYKFLSIVLLSITLCLSFSSAAEMINSGNVEAELISEYKEVSPGQVVTVLLRTVIRPEWHTYWQNPGDSGAPTTLDWILPDGFVAGDIQWPYPERIPYGPLVNFGYEGEVLFPIDITVPENQAAGLITIKAKGGWLVCSDICIPEDADLSLDLMVGSKSIDENHVSLFQTARAHLPRKLDLASSYSVNENKIKVQVQMLGLQRSRINTITYFPYQEGVIDNPSDQVLNMIDGGFELQTLTGWDYSDKSLFDGIIVIEENAGELITAAFEINPVGGFGGGSGSEMSLLLAILFAFLGGLILNLMPCVFPVLSIKILSLVQETENIKRHGWVYLAGVVLSFIGVATVLIILRASGAEIGWGFQLQSPIVVSLLAYLFLLIALNLSGYFEMGSNLMNLGQGLTYKGYSGSFFTGVLATVVAAPCTAPFMASAIGFALTQSNFAALLIFASLGLGMAAPYVLLCYSPALLKRMPKPGAWMERAKELLAFPLFASTVWLAWVLSVQTGSTGVLYWGVGALSMVFAIWLFKNLPVNKGGRFILQASGLSLIAVAIYLPSTLASVVGQEAQTSGPSDSSGPKWEAYTEARLTEYRALGPVFVDFDAAWCITCKVNESIAINTPEVMTAFEELGVRYLKGDWTNEDPVITRKLGEYGRSGVPLYLLYSGSGGRADVLPQILTKNIILSALAEMTTHD